MDKIEVEKVADLLVLKFKEIESETGCKFHLDSIRYGSDVADIKIKAVKTASVNNEDAPNAKSTIFAANAKRCRVFDYGAIGKTFMIGSRSYIVVGTSSSRSNAKVMLQHTNEAGSDHYLELSMDRLVKSKYSLV